MADIRRHPSNMPLLLVLLLLQMAAVSDGFSIPPMSVRHCRNMQLKVSTSEPPTTAKTKNDGDDGKKEFSAENSTSTSFDVLEAKLEELRTLNDAIEKRFQEEKEEMEKSSSKAWSVLEATEKGLDRLEAFGRGRWNDDFVIQTVGIVNGGRTKNNGDSRMDMARDARARGERLVSIIDEASKLRKQQQERHEASTRALLGLSEAQDRLQAKYTDLQHYLLTDQYKNITENAAATSTEFQGNRRKTKGRSMKKEVDSLDKNIDVLFSNERKEKRRKTKGRSMKKEINSVDKNSNDVNTSNGPKERNHKKKVVSMKTDDSDKAPSSASPASQTTNPSKSQNYVDKEKAPPAEVFARVARKGEIEDEETSWTPMGPNIVGVHVLDIDSEHSPQRTPDVSEWSKVATDIEGDAVDLQQDSQGSGRIENNQTTKFNESVNNPESIFVEEIPLSDFKESEPIESRNDNNQDVDSKKPEQAKARIVEKCGDNHDKGDSKIYGSVEPDQKRHEEKRKKRSYRAVKNYDQSDVLSIELEEYEAIPIPASSALTVVSDDDPQTIMEDEKPENNEEQEAINPIHCQGNLGWMSFGSLSEHAGNHFML